MEPRAALLEPLQRRVVIGKSVDMALRHERNPFSVNALQILTRETRFLFDRCRRLCWNRPRVMGIGMGAHKGGCRFRPPGAQWSKKRYPAARSSRSSARAGWASRSDVLVVSIVKSEPQLLSAVLGHPRYKALLRKMNLKPW